MEPGLGDSAQDVLKICLVWPLVWLGLAARPAWDILQICLLETSSQFAWFGPGLA